VPLSTVDWPDRLAAVIFLRGCPWRCAYCHNKPLQQRPGPSLAWTEVMDFLRQRQGLLDGVVFSGGEPTVHPGLPAALAQARALGFATALHTGGPRPDRLAVLLRAGLLDWVGFDVKAPRARYAELTGVPGSGEATFRSLRLLVGSGLPYELRTTVYPPLLAPADLLQLARELAECGAGNLVLQQYRPPEQAGATQDRAGLLDAARQVERLLGPVLVRAA